ncbi:MAG TPA: bifunctional demethylmenaquinone methyltransferase/2-methoxy-6-polyprenyl-1,4-benzoquinol methylase UbiE [Alphaproteobacteria bacterium]|nr:bifunctional demethylmenaquinone methyltransferase/2-methoxy-6-polyprenyl-1,4-benzoquinol methylase UbiE [Alphaproteobacteria bacterium]
MVRSMSEGVSREEGGETEAEADFGFRKVPRIAKSRLVRDVFDRVATRYDLMNDLMSGGVHRLWKGAMIDWLAPRPGQRLLDVAGGTGDIAFRLLARTRGQAEIVVCDINEAMVRIGRDRGLDRGLVGGIDWVCGDAQAIPLASRSVDAYTIAFGLRNVTDIDHALREARRVLRPGGRFLCLEFSRVTVPLLTALYDRYSFTVIPWIGEIVAGNREAYRYLVESIRQFPAQEALAARIGNAGFGRVSVRNLSGGIAALHSAWRL